MTRPLKLATWAPVDGELELSGKYGNHRYMLYYSASKHTFTLSTYTSKSHGTNIREPLLCVCTKFYVKVCLLRGIKLFSKAG